MVSDGDDIGGFFKVPCQRAKLNVYLNKVFSYFLLQGIQPAAYSCDKSSYTDTNNCFMVPSGVYIVKYIFKSWNNQQLKLSYKRPAFTL